MYLHEHEHQGGDALKRDDTMAATTTAQDVTKALVSGARHQLDEGLAKIEHCVAQLSDEQLWWRPRPDMNSIANLMLHLAGNLRQWIISGIGGAPDVRD